MCQVIIRGFLLRAGFRSETDLLLKGLDTFRSETRLEDPRRSVPVTKNEMFAAVTNLSDREVRVKADTVIATVETTVSLNSLSQEREKKERLYSDRLPSHPESCLQGSVRKQTENEGYSF